MGVWSLFCPNVSFHAIVRNRNPNRRGKFYDLDPELRKKILKLNERDAHNYLDGVRQFRYLCQAQAKALGLID